MLPEALKSWDYYRNKLPLYFRNDERIEEHFRAMFDMSVRTSDMQDAVAKTFDVMSTNYLDFINSFDESADKDVSEALDNIAALYSVSRDFDLEVDGVTHSLHLTNAELLMLIKARIIQFSYDGTYKQLNSFYESINLPVSVYYQSSAMAIAYLNAASSSLLTTNIELMFKAGLLTIKSMGITYSSLIVTDAGQLAVFDSSDADRLWDAGWFV